MQQVPFEVDFWTLPNTPSHNSFQNIRDKLKSFQRESIFQYKHACVIP